MSPVCVSDQVPPDPLVPPRVEPHPFDKVLPHSAPHLAGEHELELAHEEPALDELAVVEGS